MRLKHKKGQVKVQAPSNIAWVKYWGKTGVQIPMNPSISMSLDTCNTKTTVVFKLLEQQVKTQITFLFHGKENASFLPKIESFLERVKELYPFTQNLSTLKIESENTFPHSSGIASSASAFAALAFAFENIMAKLSGEEINMNRASEAARLGSGSACRSLFGGINLWGDLNENIGNDNYCEPVSGYNDIFKEAKNAILVVSSEKKSVGSTLGHSLMKGHPYARARIHQARQNCEKALEDIRSGDIWSLGKIIEEEAMSLHALMMSSSPSFVLIKSNTLEIIEKIKEFRKEKDIALFFTLDAGPNPHLLYFSQNATIVESFIENELKPLCEDGKVIYDKIGNGVKLLEANFE